MARARLLRGGLATNRWRVLVIRIRETASVYRGERVALGYTDFTSLRTRLSVYIDPVGMGQSPFHAIVIRGAAGKAGSGVVVEKVL